VLVFAHTVKSIHPNGHILLQYLGICGTVSITKSQNNVISHLKRGKGLF